MPDATSRPALDGPALDTSVLDNPVRGSLLGVHAHLARRAGEALAFPADVSPFSALPDDPTADDWAGLATLVGPDGEAWLSGSPRNPPRGWERVQQIPGVQLVAAAFAGAPDDEAVVLGPADVPEMLDLVARTRPGPFLPRTVELGRYLGIRRDGALVALAGERLRPAGFTEISAVCTDPAWRGRGFAARLVGAVAAGVVARGETPMLHAADGNPAIALYERLGFALRRELVFEGFRPPRS